MTGPKKLLAATMAIAIAGGALARTAWAQEPPAPGASPRVDAIRKAGVLRVGVLANAPWLVENTAGGGEHWSGPAWLLATEYARLLGVKLSPVLVSHETKVPVLAANQVDLSITALAENAQSAVTGSASSAAVMMVRRRPRRWLRLPNRMPPRMAPML